VKFILTQIKNLSIPKRILWIGVISFLIWYLFALPKKLFQDDYSTVLLDSNGELLGAKISLDQQWRFPPSDSIPKKFETCLLQFEDHHYYHHVGISIQGLIRAIFQNIKSNKRRSGASTITMQTIRLMRHNPARTYKEKILEMILATRLEMRCTKKEILNLYASHAPFGNNVEGLEAASWRYYGRSSFKLGWAESATLAVLPNAPGLIYPGKNHDRLLKKRNRLLQRLLATNTIDSTTYFLAVHEPLPNRPLPLPQLAPHLLQQFIASGHQGTCIQSSIDAQVQQQAQHILQTHLEQMSGNKIFNGAILISSVKTGGIIAYIGNTFSATKEHANDVNCIVAPRSSGSILKPLLFEKSLENGIITPYTIIPDIPIQFGKFSPKNYNKSYDGAVPAQEALARSLNIPMVKLLQDYGLAKFHNDLKTLGFHSIHRSPTHYGLSLILGGAEVSLFDLHRVYAEMTMQLNNTSTQHMYLCNQEKIKSKNFIMNRACIYSTFEAMTQLNRPDEEGNWKVFETSKKIAWKTGTSFGNRDAWAIGITPEYIVSVWTGNADGEGRTGLVGIKTSAPILFDLFSILPSKQKWFSPPNEELSRIALCRESGYRTSANCVHVDSVWIPTTCLQTTACPYHQSILLDKTKTFRVDSQCEDVNQMTTQTYFVLPPLIEKYYKLNHPNFVPLPNYKADCLAKISDNAMSLLYPKPGSKILIPIQLDESQGKTIFEATHKNSLTKIYWHLDNEYLGETSQIHQMALNPSIGKHVLNLIDENGLSIRCAFEVVGR